MECEPSSVVHLSIGSNLGDRHAQLSGAIDELKILDRTTLRAVSPFYETEPIGVGDQPYFLNGAVEIETALKPLELLKAVKAIEQRLGRVPSEIWGPRDIDIDIVLWADTVLNDERLTLPHSEFRNRSFVLRPLQDIAPHAVDPVTGRTIEELAAEPAAQGHVALVQS
jgi:2-amino-4-hydroxy-6-hydroxymethyldihydropteridine diphosphokinase